MSKVRICYISVGQFSHISPYLDYFKAAGHDVHFVSLSPSPDRGVPTYNMGFGSKYSITEGKWKYPFSMLRARHLIRNLRPDIVHTHYATSGGLTGLVCGFHPTITTVHGSDLNLNLKSKVWRHLLKAVFNHADCVNTCNDVQKRKVMALGIAPEKICVLTLGVDTDKFAFQQVPLDFPNHPLRIVTTRQLERFYDHSTVIKALAILRSKNISFQMTFVAGGSLLGELKAQAEQAGLGDCVRFLGGVDKKEVPEILHNNNVFLSTPIHDGISIALLEAMASGLFPIVSDIAVNRDWINNGVDGLLHAVGDPRELAECIQQLLSNPRIVAGAARRNRRKVVKFGDRNVNMGRLSSIYENLVNQKKRKTMVK